MNLFMTSPFLEAPAPSWFWNGKRRKESMAAVSSLAQWETWLEENGIAIEEKPTWDLGGQSIYFRDHGRHLLEIASPGVWPIY